MFHLAEHLGQPLSTVMAMTADEYNHWFTYLKIKAERQKEDGAKRNHNSLKAKSRRRRNI